MIRKTSVVISILILGVHCRKSFDVSSVEKGIADSLVEDLDGDQSFNSEEAIRELKHYYKYIAKKEEKMYKKQFKKQIVEDEKKQVEEFDDILKKIKLISSVT